MRNFSHRMSETDSDRDLKNTASWFSCQLFNPNSLKLCLFALKLPNNLIVLFLLAKIFITFPATKQIVTVS